jgi:hypothetical protein
MNRVALRGAGVAGRRLLEAGLQLQEPLLEGGDPARAGLPFLAHVPQQQQEEREEHRQGPQDGQHALPLLRHRWGDQAVRSGDGRCRCCG